MKKIFSIFAAMLFCSTMFADTWTVAGSNTAVFGTSWDPANTANDMVLVDGLYQFVKEDVAVAKGSIGFKVCKNHNWDEAYPSADYLLNIAEDGAYDITIKFNESTKEVTAVAEKKGSAEIEKHYLVAGDAAVVNGKGWENDNADNLMVSTDEGATYRLSIEDLTLEKKEYGYKIVEQGSWTSYYDDGKGGNAKFSIEETAIYTIEYVFTVATSQCEVIATKTGSAVVPNFYIAGSMTNWGDEKIPVYEDSYTLNLAAGKHQLKVVDGDAWLGIGNLSEVAGGLYRDQDGNICFILDAEGDVKVTYKKEEESTVFTLEGAFVAPEMQLIGINGWEAENAIALEEAEDHKSASKKVALDGDWYDFKVIRGGEWLGRPNPEEEGNYRIHRFNNWVDGLKRDGEGVKAIAIQPDLAGEYIFTYDFAAGKLTVTFPEPVLPNGYYLMGVINGAESTWDYASLKAEHILALNEGAATEEYKIVLNLAKNDEFQVVRCDWDKVGAWYPGDEDKNYVVDGSHDGLVTIYFRPKYDGDETWHYGCIQVIANDPTGVENTEANVKALKTLENGMLIIEKNGVRYTVMGQAIR